MSEISCNEIVDIAVEAGESIMEVYRRTEGIEVAHKEDASPVTEADLAAHHVIVDRLASLTPEIPVLSEESEIPGWEQRRAWPRYWLIDPLDGTKEFIHHNDEFTVNIALIEDGVPVLGVVHVPALAVTYWGQQGIGAFRSEGAEPARPIQVRGVESWTSGGGQVTVVASRRHRGPDLDACLEKIERRFGALQTSSMGSSLKICLVAEGRADLYPRLALTSEWDTAAAQAVLEAAGGAMTDTGFQTLRYNRKEELLNPFFLAIGDPAFDWQGLLDGDPA